MKNKQHAILFSALIVLTTAQSKAEEPVNAGNASSEFFYLADRYHVVSTKPAPNGQLAATYRIVSTPESFGVHFERAVELYEQGPSAALKILEELEIEIAQNPGSISARVLKARTLKGTNRCKEALLVLEELDGIADANQMISGSAELIRAECQFYEGKYVQAERTINVFERFFPDSSENRKFVPWLKSQIGKKLHPPKEPV